MVKEAEDREKNKFGLVKWDHYREARALVSHKYKIHTELRNKCRQWFVITAIEKVFRNFNKNREFLVAQALRSKTENFAAGTI